MENIADFSIWIKQLSLEVEKQTMAVMELAVSFANGAQRQARNDQAVFLRILKSRVMKEVEEIRQMESVAQSRDNNITLFAKAPAAFIFGSLYTAATRHKDAYKTGVKLAGSVLSKKIPFGMVLIGIGKEGLPEDGLAVIPELLCQLGDRPVILMQRLDCQVARSDQSDDKPYPPPQPSPHGGFAATGYLGYLHGAGIRIAEVDGLYQLCLSRLRR